MSYVNFFVAIALSALLGCGTMPGADGLSGSTSRARGVQMMVLEDDELWASRSHLLSSIDNRMPQLRILRGAGCPRLELRGRRSFTDNGSDPTIYIDGTRAVNTCVLEQMSASEAQRVEIYPMGVTSRPGYRNSPGGLILVFTRRGI